jgi:hypothetical protein
MLHPYLFHVFHPIAGVSPSPLLMAEAYIITMVAKATATTPLNFNIIFRYTNNNNYYKIEMRLLNRIAVLSALLSINAVTAINNGLGLTPAMGWNTWNRYNCNITETIIRTNAD